jgi:chemotaxis protein CheX
MTVTSNNSDKMEELNKNKIKRFISFSTPFIQAAKGVFETMVHTKLEPDKPVIKKDRLSRGDISSMIGITGKATIDDYVLDFKGMMVISFPEETFIKIVNKMLNENYTELNYDIADASSEICNMIMGNAKRELSEKGFKFKYAIPSTFLGGNHAISYPQDTTVILTKVKSHFGDFFLEVCYSDE